MDWVNFDSSKQVAITETFAVNIKAVCTECGEEIPTHFIGNPEKLNVIVNVPPCPSCFPKTFAKYKKRCNP